MKTIQNIQFKIAILISILLMATSCVEEIELETETFESILVVEGIITDREETQEIKLSRSYELSENGPSPVTNANVSITSSSGDVYLFQYTSDGIYLSETEFKATPGTEYILELSTSEGSFQSTAVIGQERTTIDEVKSVKATVKDETGVAILVNSSDDDSGSYYKYEYEETYKIVSVYEKFTDLIINDEGEFEVVPKENEEYICYNTLPSSEIILSRTTDLSETNINDYLIKFLPRTNSKLAYRYSSLVKQFKISAEAHAFYTTLKNLSESENIFSQYQPGLLSGNVQAVEESEAKVIGFFTTAAVDEKRVFFDYVDYFDPISQPRPSIYGPCEPFVPDRDLLRELVEEGQVELFAEDPPGVYVVITARCVDCNYFGTNVQPEFWIE